MRFEKSFFVLQLENGQYVGPRVLDGNSDKLYSMTRHNQDTFMSARRYRTDAHAKLAARHFKGSIVREVTVTYESNTT